MWGGIFAGAGQMLSGAMKITRTFAPNFNGAHIGKVKLWSPNAAENANTGGTLIKFGKFKDWFADRWNGFWSFSWAR